MNNLRVLPKVRDSLSYLYVEHCRIDQEAKAIAIHDQQGKFPVPCSSLTLLMLGPGTTITHAAIRALADNGCLVAWMGRKGSGCMPRDMAKPVLRETSCDRRDCALIARLG